MAAHEGVAIEFLTPEHIERYLDGHHLANTTYLSQLETLRSFFHWAKRYKRLIRINPCAGVEKPPQRRPVRPMATPEQFAAICHKTKRLEELVALHLMYYSGLRVNELCQVKVGDLDLERRLLRVRFGKGTHRSGPRERWTVINQISLPVITLFLWRAVKLHPDLYLMGKGMNRKSTHGIRRWFAARRTAASLPEDLTPHALRHGFLHLLKIKGVSLEIAANLAGHDNLETTRKVYGRLTPEEMRQVYDQALAKA